MTDRVLANDLAVQTHELAIAHEQRNCPLAWLALRERPERYRLPAGTVVQRHDVPGPCAAAAVARTAVHEFPEEFSDRLSTDSVLRGVVLGVVPRSRSHASSVIRQ